VLKKFKEKKKIILTNKTYNFTRMIAAGLKIDQCFTEILGIDSTPYSKPDPRVIDYVLKKHQSAPDNTLMVGDGINDIMVARKSGILSLALLNGLGKRDDLLEQKADYYCEDILEMNSLFY
jgi:phosphoglycolate phosphatase